MTETATIAGHRCGYAAIVGRPNVGKSTLLNRLIGQKISITSPKPQTTRQAILGIKSMTGAQIVYVDTPGLRDTPQGGIHRYMNRAAEQVLNDVDVVVFMLSGLHFESADRYVLDKLHGLRAAVILAVNKIDKIDDKTRLLPHLATLATQHAFAHIIPLSARLGENTEVLEQHIVALLPQAPPLFPEDQITDRSERFLAAEFVREQLFLLLAQELPYALTVETEKFKRQDGVLHISALIWVAKAGHKAMVIGQHGAVLKEVGRRARMTMQQSFQSKVFLQLWVKVRRRWTDDEQALRQFGFTDT